MLFWSARTDLAPGPRSIRRYTSRNVIKQSQNRAWNVHFLALLHVCVIINEMPCHRLLIFLYKLYHDNSVNLLERATNQKICHGEPKTSGHGRFQRIKKVCFSNDIDV